MNTPVPHDTQPFDPEGSIFLPTTQYPEREFDRWYFELLIGRGIGRDRTAEEILLLGQELAVMRQRYLGTVALGKA